MGIHVKPLRKTARLHLSYDVGDKGQPVYTVSVNHGRYCYFRTLAQPDPSSAVQDQNVAAAFERAEAWALSHGYTATRRA